MRTYDPFKGSQDCLEYLMRVTFITIDQLPFAMKVSVPSNIYTTIRLGDHRPSSQCHFNGWPTAGDRQLAAIVNKELFEGCFFCLDSTVELMGLHCSSHSGLGCLSSRILFCQFIGDGIVEQIHIAERYIIYTIKEDGDFRRRSNGHRQQQLR